MITLIIELVLALAQICMIAYSLKLHDHIDGLSRRANAIEKAINQLSTDSNKNISVAVCNAYTVANSAENRSFNNSAVIEVNSADIEELKRRVKELEDALRN